ncbi:MAG TPA: SRPBCC family protein [Gaiellaceae bacterium]
MAQADQVKEKAGQAKEKVENATNGNGQGDSLKKVLVPAVAGIGSLAATYAARRATEALKERAEPQLEEKGKEQLEKVGGSAAEKMKKEGGIGGKVAGKALEKVTGGGAGSSSSGKTRRLPIQRWTDVAAPIDVVWERWTEFEDFPKFMHRVLSVKKDKEEENKLSWDEKIWFSSRHWEGEITERRKNDRIAWKTTKGMKHSGVVTFHRLAPNLTRVMVDMEFQPQGIMEKMASGMRFVKRAVQSDLARFKAYVEMGEAEGISYRHDPKEGSNGSNGNRRSGGDSKQDD